MHSLPFMERYKENISTDLGIRLLGGGAAGVTAATFTYPLDLVRTRLAAQVITFITLVIYYSFEFILIFLILLK